jgi:hypothetical protein
MHRWQALGRRKAVLLAVCLACIGSAFFSCLYMVYVSGHSTALEAARDAGLENYAETIEAR